MYAFDNSIILQETKSGYVGLVDNNVERFYLEFRNYINNDCLYGIRSSYIGNTGSGPTILANKIEDVIGNTFKVFKWKTIHSTIYLVAENQSTVKQYTNRYESEDSKDGFGTITELGRVKCYGRNRNGFYI